MTIGYAAVWPRITRAEEAMKVLRSGMLGAARVLSTLALRFFDSIGFHSGALQHRLQRIAYARTTLPQRPTSKWWMEHKLVSTAQWAWKRQHRLNRLNSRS